MSSFRADTRPRASPRAVTTSLPRPGNPLGNQPPRIKPEIRKLVDMVLIPRGDRLGYPSTKLSQTPYSMPKHRLPAIAAVIV
jgi:hypothetical protein